jgi:hypothetical protein
VTTAIAVARECYRRQVVRARHIWRRMMSAIASVAGFQIAASPIELGDAVKWGATTPLVASLWKIAGILSRVSVTR